MKRKTININGSDLSYLDNEKSGPVLIALHGHFGMGSMFQFLETIFDGRLILPDQRGHGFSDHPDSHSPDDYVEDLHQLIQHLKIEKPILLGHSLGGVNVYRYAARYSNVSMIIVEDIGTEISGVSTFFSAFPDSFSSVQEVHREFQKCGLSLTPYFMESLYYDGLRWRFRFCFDDILKSEKEISGSYMEDWEKIECPILLLHGARSWACSTENIRNMAGRMNVDLKIYEDASHGVHDDARGEYCKDVATFIQKKLPDVTGL